MSETNQMEIPGVVFGILHPNLRNHFRVRFTDIDNNPLPYSNSLSDQVTACGGIDSVSMFGGVDNVSTNVAFTLQDDTLNKAFAGVLALKNLEAFNVHIDTLAGNDVVTRTVTLKEARVTRFLHSDYDYACSARKSTANIVTQLDNHVGNLIEQLKQDPTAAALLTALSNARISVTIGDEPAQSPACQISVIICYASVEYMIPNQNNF